MADMNVVKRSHQNSPKQKRGRGLLKLDVVMSDLPRGEVLGWRYDNQLQIVAY